MRAYSNSLMRYHKTPSPEYAAKENRKDSMCHDAS